MAFDHGDSPSLPPPPPPPPDPIDEEELRRISQQRRSLEAKRVGRRSLRVDVSNPGLAANIDTGLRLT